MIGVAIYVGTSLAGMFGIACCALGMLSTLATGEQLSGPAGLLGIWALRGDRGLQSGVAEGSRRDRGKAATTELE